MIPQQTLIRVLAASLAAAMLVASVQTCRAARASERARESDFRADSIAARSDTSRDVTGELVALLGDSLRAAERRILQIVPDRDVIDRTLGRTSAAVAALRAEVRSLGLTVTRSGVTEDSTGTRRVTFPIDSTPYHGTARVEVPRLPAPATLALDLELEPAPLGLRIQCEAGAGTVRSATALVTAPAWLTVSIDSVRSDPNVCNPTPVDCRIPVLGFSCPSRRALFVTGLVVGGAAGAYAGIQAGKRE